MSESDSFINEVSEEVRRERLYATLRKYGWLIAIVIILIVGAAGAHEWRKARDTARAEATGEALRAAYQLPDATARADALAALAAEEPHARALVDMARAGALVAADDRAAAADVLATLADGGADAELYEALAALQRVMLLGAQMDKSERAATLERLSAEGAPFRPLALEQRALMRLEDGDDAGAQADLAAILTAPGAPEALQGRARQLIIATGGTLSAAGMPVEPDGGTGEGAPPPSPTDG